MQCGQTYVLSIAIYAGDHCEIDVLDVNSQLNHSDSDSAHTAGSPTKTQKHEVLEMPCD
jgi:hypothetical protein